MIGDSISFQMNATVTASLAERGVETVHVPVNAGDTGHNHQALREYLAGRGDESLGCDHDQQRHPRPNLVARAERQPSTAAQADEIRSASDRLRREPEGHR